jgi:uncharacterized protein (TIGR02679 family)
MIYAPDRLRELLTKPALSQLMERFRSRIRQGRKLDSPVALSSLTREERSAIDSLLNRRPSSGRGITIRPDEIERILTEAQLCDSLEEALVHVFGPVVNERLIREAGRRSWVDLRTLITSEYSDLSNYQPWYDFIFAKGKLKRLCKRDCELGARYLQVVGTVLRGIPWPIVSLADLATRLTGDSHALDRGMPLSQLCLSAITSQHPMGEVQLSRRQLWEWAGVVIDELSAPVLVLNLRADPTKLVGQMLNAFADVGEPCHLSVRLLRSGGASVFDCIAGKAVYACENPSVVAAAAQRLGSTSSPLICTAGQPASAPQLLLSLLKSAKCPVFCHGDFDSAGINITNLLIERYGVYPWRMATTDYLTCASRGPVLGPKCASASWDANLASLLLSHGHAVLEESMLDILVDDLRRNL